MKRNLRCNPGLVQCSIGKLTIKPKIGSLKMEKISKYFVKETGHSKEDFDSPYKENLTEQSPVLNDSTEERDFKTPKCIKRPVKKPNPDSSTHKVVRKSKGNVKKKSKQKQRTLSELLENQFSYEDANPEHLQLAIALSESEQAMESFHEISLSSFPSTQEKIAKMKTTLEQFGFKSNKRSSKTVEFPTETFKRQKTSKYRFITPILYLRTEEDRQAFIAEKISLIMAQPVPQPTDLKTKCTLSSDYLQKLLYVGTNYFERNNFNYEIAKNKDSYYIKSLNIPKCEIRCGSLLKNWDNIPGRDRSPSRDFEKLGCSENMFNISTKLIDSKPGLNNENLKPKSFSNNLNDSKTGLDNYNENSKSESFKHLNIPYNDTDSSSNHNRSSLDFDRVLLNSSIGGGASPDMFGSDDEIDTREFCKSFQNSLEKSLKIIKQIKQSTSVECDEDLDTQTFLSIQSSENCVAIDKERNNELEDASNVEKLNLLSAPMMSNFQYFNRSKVSDTLDVDMFENNKGIKHYESFKDDPEILSVNFSQQCNEECIEISDDELSVNYDIQTRKEIDKSNIDLLGDGCRNINESFFGDQMSHKTVNEEKTDDVLDIQGTSFESKSNISNSRKNNENVDYLSISEIINDVEMLLTSSNKMGEKIKCKRTRKILYENITENNESNTDIENKILTDKDNLEDSAIYLKGIETNTYNSTLEIVKNSVIPPAISTHPLPNITRRINSTSQFSSHLHKEHLKIVENLNKTFDYVNMSINHEKLNKKRRSSSIEANRMQLPKYLSISDFNKETNDTLDNLNITDYIKNILEKPSFYSNSICKYDINDQKTLDPKSKEVELTDLTLSDESDNETCLEFRGEENCKNNSDSNVPSKNQIANGKRFIISSEPHSYISDAIRISNEKEDSRKRARSKALIGSDSNISDKVKIPKNSKKQKRNEIVSDTNSNTSATRHQILHESDSNIFDKISIPKNKIRGNKQVLYLSGSDSDASDKMNTSKSKKDSRKQDRFEVSSDSDSNPTDKTSKGRRLKMLCESNSSIFDKRTTSKNNSDLREQGQYEVLCNSDPDASNKMETSKRNESKGDSDKIKTSKNKKDDFRMLSQYKTLRDSDSSDIKISKERDESIKQLRFEVSSDSDSSIPDKIKIAKDNQFEGLYESDSGGFANIKTSKCKGDQQKQVLRYLHYSEDIELNNTLFMKDLIKKPLQKSQENIEFVEHNTPRKFRKSVSFAVDSNVLKPTPKKVRRSLTFSSPTKSKIKIKSFCFKRCDNVQKHTSMDSFLQRNDSVDSVYINDEELNYSSLLSTPHRKISKSHNLDEVIDTNNYVPTTPPEKINHIKSNTDHFSPITSLKNLRVQELTFSPNTSFSNQIKRTPSTKTSTENVATPQNGLIIKIKNISPILDYDRMNTPTIQKELEKVGVKNLKRHRGVQILKHIYEATHPVVDVNRIEEGSDDNRATKRHKSNVGQQAILEKNNISEKLDLSTTNVLNYQRDVDKKNQMKIIEIVGDIPESDDLIFERRRLTKIPSCQVPLHIAWHNLVSCNQDVKENILLYEPLQLEVLYQMLKDQGYKYHIQDLLTFLDKKCVTIRTNENGSRNIRRTGKRKKTT